MHPCRECGKAVETTAQFCPWCFALPGTASEAAAPRPEPVAAAVAVVEAPVVTAPPTPPPPPAGPTAPPVLTWGAPVTPSRLPRILLVGGVAALVVALVATLLVQRSGGGDTAPEDVLVRAEDLGSGWTADGEVSTERVSAEDADLARCLGVPAPDPRESASSPSFTREQASTAAQVRRWPDRGAAEAEIGQLRHPKFVECAVAATAGSLADEGIVVDPARTRVEGPAPLPGVPGATRVRIGVSVPVEGVGEGLVWIDLIGAVRGNGSISMFTMNAFSPPPEDVEVAAMTAMLGRL